MASVVLCDVSLQTVCTTGVLSLFVVQVLVALHADAYDGHCVCLYDYMSRFSAQLWAKLGFSV